MSNEKDNPILPDLSGIIKTTIADVQPEKTVAQKKDEAWARLGRNPDWKNLLKPYLEDRMAILRSMLEVNFTGKETVQEVGVRFLLCSAVANELQNLIDRVEIPRQVLDKLAEAEKERAKKSLEKELVKEKKGK